MRLCLILLILGSWTAGLAVDSGDPAVQKKLKAVANAQGLNDPVTLPITPELRAKITAQAAAFGHLKCGASYVAYYIKQGSTLIPMNYETTAQQIKAGVLEQWKTTQKIKIVQIEATGKPFPDVQMIGQAGQVQIYGHTFMRPEQGFYRYYTYFCR